VVVVTGFVMCGCVCVGFVMCGCVYVGFCNVWVCVCVGYVMCGCTYVWVLISEEHTSELKSTR
jgi:hypothetical protein